MQSSAAKIEMKENFVVVIFTTENLKLGFWLTEYDFTRFMWKTPNTYIFWRKKVTGNFVAMDRATISKATFADKTSKFEQLDP